MSHNQTERVRQAFSQQAGAFEDRRFNRVFTDDARWLFQRLQCHPQDVLLDVAAGTGHAARELAPRVRLALAVDLTPEMLTAGKLAAEQAGLRNVLFQLGDATALPFLADSFDVVVSRFAFHHLEEPAAVLSEMTRCLRPGGTLLLADMVADEDPVLAAGQDRLEQLRDPSHTRMLPPSELAALLGAGGLAQISTEVRELDRALAPWLEQAQTPRDAAVAIRVELEAELDGGAHTGLRPHELDGELRFHQRWASALAVKPAA
jgi:ubiquinone/menaquinone biosynthesis C-methylase UbiE